ncbi:MAG: Gfo/Idh/MocA family oxidoreductase [Bryobacterales bacterium]|nr:Gfo/Idh/MocA family oxidoreductase [Bryobacterales bacterium]
MTEQSLSRRRCLKAAVFTILPGGLARGYQANEKLSLGVIGLAGMGSVDARELAKLGENITALCDVDSEVLEKRGATYPDARRYTDFRRMFEKEKLDGVVVATPDHNHAYISVLAMTQGLHVYCEKPLTQTMYEARVMARVAAERKAITQMGTSSSASEGNMRTVELIQSGALGEITEVHCWTNRPIWPQGFERPSGEEPVPETLNWDLWSGPAQVRGFRAKWPEGHPVYSLPKDKLNQGRMYHPFSWRGWLDYGTGALGDIAPHSLNVVFWALDLGAPDSAEVVACAGMKPAMYPEWSVIRFDFGPRGVHPPMKLFWYDGGKFPPLEISGENPGGGGLVFIGTKGSLPQGRGPFYGRQTEPYAPPPQRQWDRESVHKDWARGIRTGRPPGCHFGYAGPFTEAYLLGNIALRIGHRVEWNPLTFRVTNCQEANQYLRRDDRKGWELQKISGVTL